MDHESPNQDTEIKPPQCCCCNIRIGLAILFFINLALGISSFISQSWPAAVVWTIISLSGLASIWFKRYLKPTLILFITGQTIMIVLAVLGIATADAVAASIEDDTAKRQFISGVYLSCISSIVISLLFILLATVYMRRYMVFLNKLLSI